MNGLTPTQNQVMGQLRILLPALGTVAIALGWVSAEQVGGIIVAVINIAGSAMILGGAVWQVIANSKKSILTAAAQIPEVQKGNVPIVLAPADNTPEAKKEVAELVKATPDNVVAKT